MAGLSKTPELAIKEFRTDINGLRAYAVLAVIFYHFHVLKLSGGFVGVDIFFVISGFLMSKIIINGLTTSSLSIIKFYLARARRIIPALFALCCVLFILGVFVLFPNPLSELDKQIFSSSIFLSNIYFWQHSSDYFNSSSSYKFLLHTWSLSVEWQFYMLYPIVLWALWKIKPSLRFITICMVCGFVVSLGCSVILSKAYPTFSFYFLPTRAWEMLTGGLVFISGNKLSIFLTQKRKIILESLGFILIIISIFFITVKDVWPGFLATIPVLGAALVLLANRQNSPWTSHKILQSIGEKSYSLYLWHWPVWVLIYSASMQNRNEIIIGGIILSFILGYLSYLIVEHPLRVYLGKLKNVKSCVVFITATLLICLVTYKGIYIKTVVHPLPTKYEKLYPVNAKDGYCSNQGYKKSQDSISICQLGDKTQKNVEGFLFGDSFASQYDPFFDEIFKPNKIKIDSIGFSSCNPSLSTSYESPKDSAIAAYKLCLYNRDYVAKNLKKYKFVILAGRWRVIYEKGFLNETIEFANLALSKGLKVYIMASPTEYDVEVQRLMQANINFGAPFDIKSFSKNKDSVVREANLLLEQYANKTKGVTFIPKSAIFNPSDTYTKEGTVFLYSYDGAHISEAGSIVAGQEFMQGKYYPAFIAGIKADVH